ncbi:hypothetical protein ACFLXC_06875 [Chloroflexota bacterium]
MFDRNEGGRRMIRTKSCPKCKGVVLIDRDQYGWFEQCIQCGLMKDLKLVAPAPDPATLRIRKKRQPR